MATAMEPKCNVLFHCLLSPACVSVCLFAFFCSCHLFPPLPLLLLGVILNDRPFLVMEGGPQYPWVIFYSNGTQ